MFDLEANNNPIYAGMLRQLGTTFKNLLVETRKWHSGNNEYAFVSLLGKTKEPLPLTSIDPERILEPSGGTSQRPLKTIRKYNATRLPYIQDFPQHLSSGATRLKSHSARCALPAPIWAKRFVRVLRRRFGDHMVWRTRFSMVSQGEVMEQNRQHLILCWGHIRAHGQPTGRVGSGPQPGPPVCLPTRPPAKVAAAATPPAHAGRTAI